jgi:hypothetical protein
MPQPTQKPDTAAIEVAKYSLASQVGGVPVADTLAVKTEIRTVVTRATQGTLELRYTPRDPGPTTAKTSP